MIKKRLATIFLILILSGGLFSCRKEVEKKLEVTGGPCDYEADPVTITVSKIEKEVRGKNETSNLDSEMLIIDCDLTFDGNINTGKIQRYKVEVKSVEAKAKGVKVGKKFHASVSRLVSGTCNPEPIYPHFEEWK